jgi:hypothetical protein
MEQIFKSYTNELAYVARKVFVQMEKKLHRKFVQKIIDNFFWIYVMTMTTKIYKLYSEHV